MNELLFIELTFQKLRIFPSTPLTFVAIFLSYLVVTPLMLGFEREFSCHSNLGPIRIPPLLPYAPVSGNAIDSGLGTLDSLSAFCIPKILLLKWVGHRLFQIIIVLFYFPMLQLPYQFPLEGMARFILFLGILVMTQLFGNLSARFGIRSNTRNSSLNPTTSPTSLPPTLSRTSIETAAWFHVLSSIGYSSPFVSLFPLSVSISSKD